MPVKRLDSNCRTKAISPGNHTVGRDECWRYAKSANLPAITKSADFYPNYIYDGIAIHGSPLVPTSPASHGCIRIPMFAAREFSEIVTIGMVIVVYNSETLAQTGAAETAKHQRERPIKG